MGNNEVLDKMKGSTIKHIEGLREDSEEVTVYTDKGKWFFHHVQDCCESVDLHDYELDADLTGALINSAEEVTSQDEDPRPRDWSESWTWTFYKIETNKGGLWMRWLGESNGYYSESVKVRYLLDEERHEGG